ncbi:exodeoxyribonuclease III [Promineifilum sp.]|uniref:exodeoxyribonuclease III n=1 Tax=Promineifilum sp. TaxID=2664178 RepID=UPI0035B140B5
MLHLYSWNVNGLRAVHRKGIFLEWLAAAQPDILGIQETKCHPDQLDDALRAPPGYHTYWASSARPGYSGVALYTRREPVTVAAGLGIDAYDLEGRTLVADFGDFVFITAYFPNGSRDHSRVPFKMQYNADFLDYIDALRAAGRPLIFCGDVNTSHQEIDLARPRQNRHTTGFLSIEREWIDRVVAGGYVDTFRARYPDTAGAYTWWSQVTGSRDKNVGWRLDYFFVSPDLWPRVAGAAIHPEVMGSDHCPVSLILDMDGEE